MKYDTHKKSILKSLVWRIIGIFWLGLITWFFTRNLTQTSLTTIIHHSTFLIIFYLHERAWLKIKIDFKGWYKAVTYEIILGNIILGLITYFVTGDVKKMTAITLTYILTKLIMYVIYDKIWQQKTVVYAYVVADILHTGHLQFLEKAKAQGDKLIVGVLTDMATKEKKSMPIIHYPARTKMIAALKCVDKVIAQYKYSPLGNIQTLKPDILIESTSHTEQPANDYVENYGGKVIILPYSQGQSSTKIKEKIKRRG